jgi:hypothetical protein
MTGKRARSPAHALSSSVPAGALDLSAVARQAVLGFLQDASIATAERQATDRVAGAPAAAASAVAATDNTVSLIATESSAWQAAAISADALDRIEAAAAKVEADIAAAAQAHAEMQAGVGAAVEEAVRAAQSAMGSADTAVQADRRVTVIMRRIEHYTAITVGILIVALILLTVISV